MTAHPVAIIFFEVIGLNVFNAHQFGKFIGVFIDIAIAHLFRVMSLILKARWFRCQLASESNCWYSSGQKAKHISHEFDCNLENVFAPSKLLWLQMFLYNATDPPNVEIVVSLIETRWVKIVAFSSTLDISICVNNEGGDVYPEKSILRHYLMRERERERVYQQ